MLKNRRILIALGGNAIKRPKDLGTHEEMQANLDITCSQLAKLVTDGHKLCLTHGNGPQVGQIFLRNQRCAPAIPPWSLNLCVAESEGLLGYMFQQQFHNALAKENPQHTVATLITQMEVLASDPAFLHPSKPVGAFHSEEEAMDMMQLDKRVTLKEDSGRGWRVVVPSPNPVRIIEAACLKALCALDNTTVIAAGGGGIPVLVDTEGRISGCDAVVDKDYAAVILGREAQSNLLMLVTDVDHVFLNYGRPTQEKLGTISLKQARRFVEEGHFQAGSMLPKVQACIQFVEETNHPAVITSLAKVGEALKSHVGTWFVKE